MSIEPSVSTVVLHIGRHKTGTSSIQETLARSHKYLRQCRVLYTNRLPMCHSGFFVNAFADHPENNPVHNRIGRSRKQIEEEVTQNLQELRQEIRETSADTVIFSGEDACSSLSAAGVLRMKNTFDALYKPQRYRILMYTRDPISFARSAIQQNVKANGTTLADAKRFFGLGGALRYAEVYRKYSDVFGTEALEFRSFESGVAEPEGLVSGFFRHLCIPTEGISMRRVNESICSEVVHFMSWLVETDPATANEAVMLPQNRKTRVPVTQEDKAALFSLHGSSGQFLSNEEQGKLWEAVSDDMAFLEQTVGIRYFPPQAGAPQEPMFGSDFMTQLQYIFQKLSSPVQKEMLFFLEGVAAPEDLALLQIN